ncbi:hypothetical protein CLHOM_05450 [Clostridium homopropionicum DSM 5847]|uniref:Prepilin-type N-terminal cleavage/methylation domain-containing protein n=1 Tax=Clostridium homopropionicum DSM 5847 TaxID=1121318 RepID=A0A0L6ZDC7_9CLOT|nr:prepilin-type N-terminal cleavage/methylation domain-containing protein [Clostridium homopropionicum]KOA20957.1 hypothetical protein CLHOM_05450 [Clostridium homopropionicum DSM 5847]SFG01165.1 prepilin-type N-terminal cleavage/methylation domain-containing protein [Clostridium homopropionicum]
MSKLKRNKGYSLIEVICSLSILLILTSYLISYQYKYYNLKKQNIDMVNRLCFVEAVCNNFKFHYSYEELINFLNYNKAASEKIFYINKTNLNLEKLNTNGLIDILSDKQEAYPYLKLSFNLTDENIIIIDLFYVYMRTNKEESLNFRFTKGDF